MPDGAPDARKKVEGGPQAFRAALLDILKSTGCGNGVEELRALRDQDPRKTIEALLELMNSPDQMVRRRAGGSLGQLREFVSEKAPILIDYLEHHGDARVRLSCAIHLMPVNDPKVDQAYLRALKDPSEKVVQLACLEVGSRCGAQGAIALFDMLDHKSWRVRLEVCKALIRLYANGGSWIPAPSDSPPTGISTRAAVSARILEALERMHREPEAAIYDAECDEFETDFAAIVELSRQSGLAAEANSPGSAPAAVPEVWGKLQAIIDIARQIGLEP